MSNPPNEPARFVTCPCQHCNGGIEFDASGFEKGETSNVECPHCHLETMIFVPARQKSSSIPPILKRSNFKRKIWWTAGILFGLFVFVIAWPVKWIQSNTWSNGNVSVKIDGMYTAPDFVPNGIGSGVDPTGSHFHLRLTVKNISQNKNFNIETLRHGGAWLSDTNGNEYSSVSLYPEPTYLQDSASLNPGQEFSDMLIFTPPMGGLKTLRLQFSKNDIGAGFGNVRLEFPVNFDAPLPF